MAKGSRSAGVSMANSPLTTDSTSASPTKVVSHGCGENHWPLDRRSCSSAASRLRSSKYGSVLACAAGRSSDKPARSTSSSGGLFPENCATASSLYFQPVGVGSAAPCTASNLLSAASSRSSVSSVLKSAGQHVSAHVLRCWNERERRSGDDRHLSETSAHRIEQVGVAVRRTGDLLARAGDDI